VHNVQMREPAGFPFLPRTVSTNFFSIAVACCPSSSLEDRTAHSTSWSACSNELGKPGYTSTPAQARGSKRQITAEEARCGTGPLQRCSADWGLTLGQMYWCARVCRAHGESLSRFE
jgi:hypothetical protein